MTKKKKRAPIVVMLGHIDHGKTSILDYIRKSKVQEKETAGITQHIGAYQIQKDNKKITFIDTPGHEAFSAIRSRGAKLADISILVIDAVDGIKAQTKEAISHIKESKIPFIVALNKSDKYGASPDKVRQELLKEDIVVEDLGGKVPSVDVSAKTGDKIEDLIDLIFLMAEMENLEADFANNAKGIVIESLLDKKRGPVITIITKSGIFKKGDIVSTPSVLGKIKKMENFLGNQIMEAEPSTPFALLGFEGIPNVGEEIQAFDSLEGSRKNIKKLKEEEKIIENGEDQKILNLILKTDVVGSIEAIKEVLKKLPQDKVVLKFLKAETGEINENDFKLAKDSRAIILGFRVGLSKTGQIVSDREKVRIIMSDIIYDLADEIKKFMERKLESKVIRKDLARLKILVVFMTDKKRQIIGARVIDGEVEKGLKIEIFREEELIGKGKIINLQRNKKDISRLGKGEEAGILYEGTGRAEKGDILIVYKKETRKDEL